MHPHTHNPSGQLDQQHLLSIYTHTHKQTYPHNKDTGKTQKSHAGSGNGLCLNHPHLDVEIFSYKDY